MTNKTARQELERIYGKGCMFFKANIPERLRQAGIQIKGYKVFVGEKRYKGKKIKRLETTMTYHHLEHNADGGKTNVENGAIVNELAHRYMHSLPRQDEEIINDMLRDYKREFELKGGIIMPTETGLEVIQPIQITFGEIDDQDCITIPLYDGR